MKHNNKIIAAVLILLLGLLAGCADGKGSAAVPEKDAPSFSAKAYPAIGLILSAEDAVENEELIGQFTILAVEEGGELLIRIPEVTAAMAEEARKLTGAYVQCEVDPIEYQMLYVNELVAEDVDVIAIHANHPEGLEPVLTAARAVGIKVCAFGQEVGEESCDIYAEADEALEAVHVLLKSE